MAVFTSKGGFEYLPAVRSSSDSESVSAATSDLATASVDAIVWFAAVGEERADARTCRRRAVPPTMLRARLAEAAASAPVAQTAFCSRPPNPKTETPSPARYRARASHAMARATATAGTARRSDTPPTCAKCPKKSRRPRTPSTPARPWLACLESRTESFRPRCRACLGTCTRWPARSTSASRITKMSTNIGFCR